MQNAYSLFLFSIKLQADYVLYLLKEACNGGNDLLHGLDEADDLSLGVGHLLEGVLHFLDAGLPITHNPYREFILSFGGKPTAKYRWFQVALPWVNRMVGWFYDY